MAAANMYTEKCSVFSDQTVVRSFVQIVQRMTAGGENLSVMNTGVMIISVDTKKMDV